MESLLYQLINHVKEAMPSLSMVDEDYGQLEANDDAVVRPEDISADKPQPGLDNNPGKDGHIFNDTHPYFPYDCRHCPFNKGFKNKAAAFFKNEEKHCNNCTTVDNTMKIASDELKKAQDFEPPQIDTYIASHNAMVYTSQYHGKNEIRDNKRIAEFIADKLNCKVYLLPRLDPDNPNQASLRGALMPKGVPKRKNPDYYIVGKLFDGKSMMKIQKSENNKKYHNDILNRIKSAKKQADNMILEIPDFVSRKIISTTIKGFLIQASKKRIIVVKHGRKCYVYNNKYLK